MSKSIEPNIADLGNGWLKQYKLDYKLEQESLNSEIDKALSEYFTKNGGTGANRPDVKLLLQDKQMDYYPILIEYKGQISLPAKNNEPDYKFMELLISALKKMAIKDTVEWVNNKKSFTICK